MLREAVPADLGRVLEFLERRPETSMFLRSNLLAHGMEESSHPHASELLLWEEGAALKGVFGRNNQGNLVSQCPDAPRAVWGAIADWLTGKDVVSFVGEPDQVLAGISAFGWKEDALSLNETEPLYRLAIEDVVDPGVDIRKPNEEDLPILQEWFTGYALELGEEEPGRAAKEAVRRARRALDQGTTRFMIQKGQPVCMVGTNARTPDMVQIGGVFTPETLRGRGYAGQALAAYLLEFAGTEVTQCILFAASRKAARAYEKIGFNHIGHYHVTMLKAPMIQGHK